VAAALGFFSPLALGAFFALGAFAGAAAATTGAASSAILELGCCSFGFGNQTDEAFRNLFLFIETLAYSIRVLFAAKYADPQIYNQYSQWICCFIIFYIVFYFLV
jgi:hypothetical protein